MSDSIIKDGTGTGASAMVGDKNRLHTHALSTTAASNATMEGDAFNVSSELITLTSANESALLYIKNNEDHSISVTTLFVNLGTSTGGSGESLISFKLAPTGGTLISDETAAQTLNRNIGNNTTLTAATYKGAEGKTITGGDTIQLPSTGGPITSEYVLPKGAAFSLSMTPPTGNTSMQVQIGFLVLRNYESYTIE
jgi:hypothetical protein